MVWQAIAERINPDFRAQGIGVHITRVIQQTADCKTFVLASNRGLFGARWPATYQAGQHCVVTVRINGRHVHRSFSISSAPGAELQITVKANASAKGRFSASEWMLKHLSVGSELTLSAPEGDFIVDNQTLGEEVKELSFISAGSGITPIRAILQALQQRYSAGNVQKIRLIHLCRDPEEFIFGSEMAALAKSWPALTLIPHYSAQLGRIQATQLYQYLGDRLDQSVYLCGPSQLQAEVFKALDLAGYHGPRRSEHFGALTLSHSDNAPLALSLEQDQIKRLFTVTAGQSLLLTLEQAGARVASGCRIGICNTCQCLKRSGAVQNLRTGEITDSPNELIRLCVSAPLSPLTLSL